MCKSVSFADKHMEQAGHFDHIFKYILSLLKDQQFASNTVDALRQGKLIMVNVLLNDEAFLNSCVDISPSEYYNEKWRKKGHLQVTIKQRDLYFEFVFSKTSDCLKIVTAYPNRRAKEGSFYYPVSC